VRILVAVKQVAVLAEELELDGDGAVARDELQWRLNEWDAFSVQAALALNEGEQGEVLVATVGAEHAEEGLRTCLAMGADRALRVWGDELADADSLAVAATLAALARRERPDLILCGAQSSDAGDAATGVALAGLLDLAHVAVVVAIERDGDRLTVQREVQGGAIEVLQVRAPALLTVQTGINEPRHPTLREIKRARGAPIEVLSPDVLGLEAGELATAAGARIVRLLEPPNGDGARVLDGRPDRIAAQIAQIVQAALSA
jgi:electron transfer flavoprotein beta subunit